MGSFSNVLIWRLPKRKSILFPGSHCTNCGNKIKFFDNIPIISYIILGGKCRNCKSPISPRYPIIELTVGLAYLFSYLFYNPIEYMQIIRMIIIFPLFLAISWIDVEHRVIPDELTLSVAIVGIVLTPIVYGWQGLINSMIGAAAGALLFWIISVLGKIAFRKTAMGEGDIFLIAAIGLLTGWKGVLMVIFISALLGAIAGTIMIVLSKIYSRNHKETDTSIPFAPFLCAATIIVIICGEKLLQYYLGLFI